MHWLYSSFGETYLLGVNGLYTDSGVLRLFANCGSLHYYYCFDENLATIPWDDLDMSVNVDRGMPPYRCK